MDSAHVIVRAPSLTDAVGAGMAQALYDRDRFGSRLPEEYWASHTEADAVQYWHDVFSTRKPGRRIALALAHRRIVGVCALEAARTLTRFPVPPAREEEIVAFPTLPAAQTPEVMQRLLDFVLPGVAPCQCWVWREDQALRRFLRMNGFTLDGVTCVDAETGVEYSRLVR